MTEGGALGLDVALGTALGLDVGLGEALGLGLEVGLELEVGFGALMGRGLRCKALSGRDAVLFHRCGRKRYPAPSR